MQERTLDTSGLNCPEPVMLLHSEIRAMEDGERVKVIATDPSTARDVPQFCNFLQHTLIEQIKDVENSKYTYIVKKGL